MRFILGLIFGVAVTFSGAWYLTSAQDVDLAEPDSRQTMPEVAALPVAETPANGPTEPELGQMAWTRSEEQTEPAEPAESTEQTAQNSEPVWTVFHSEASASGFANYLSQSINHPFEVTKLGPAQYQVSYSYSSSEQAQMLAAKIKMITGAQ